MDGSFWNFEGISGMAQTTSDSGWSRRNPGFWITLKFLLPLLYAKPKMVLPPSEQHCLGEGVWALTAFYYSNVLTLALPLSTIMSTMRR